MLRWNNKTEEYITVDSICNSGGCLYCTGDHNNCRHNFSDDDADNLYTSMTATEATTMRRGIEDGLKSITEKKGKKLFHFIRDEMEFLDPGALDWDIVDNVFILMFNSAPLGDGCGALWDRRKIRNWQELYYFIAEYQSYERQEA